MVKILVPTDYSNNSLAALKHAASLARGTEGSLLILHVLESGSSFALSEDGNEKDHLHRDFELLLKSFSENESPVRYEERFVEGIPVSAILSMAITEQSDLIVMGTTGRSGLKRILLGSVAEEICRRAPCPVLILNSQNQAENIDTSDSNLENWTSLERAPATPTQGEVTKLERFSDNPTLALLSRAIAARASDIHIDPMGREFSVRFRIDGQLTNYCRLSQEVGRSLLTQLKITGNLDIADPFHPKEGRLTLPDTLGDFEVRITAVPVIDGEAISLRVLNRTRLMRSMEQLGLLSDAQLRIDHILRHGEGIVLVTGPTGSGKTTTLYSMLHVLDDGSRNIVTIEDPVEYDIPTFRQMPVDLKHGVTMANGLRTLLRLDPDVVLVGEIRDAEAAETAMRAASSGKYVFSSLHTRDVASTVTALRDLHVDDRSLAGNLAGIISQRLVRRLCNECRRPSALTEKEVALFIANGLTPPKEIHHPVGCQRCRGTGHYDRIGLFEVVTSDDEIVRAIEEGETEDDLQNLMQSHNVCTLEKDALQKVCEGVIGIEEVEKMTSIELDRQVCAVK